MHTHRLYIYLVFLSIFISCLIASNCDEHTNDDKIPFAIRVQQSPIILIGTSLNKMLDTRIRNLFNVTFLVECILKGQPTKRVISIVQAGSLLGRRSCQQLDVNRQYLVFLEPFFDDSYRPVDFKEIPYSSQINIVLAKTCGLSKIYPFTEVNDADEMLMNKCPPVVSIGCLTETLPTTTTTIESIITTTPPTTTVMIPSSTKSIPKSPLNPFNFGKNPIDFEALSLLLAGQQHQQNLSLAFFQDHNHKSLFSDDDTRKNHANQYSFTFSIYSLVFTVFYLLL